MDALRGCWEAACSGIHLVQQSSRWCVVMREMCNMYSPGVLIESS